METVNDTDLWKTDKLSLAAFLRMHLPVLDMKWEDSEWDSGSCYWYFEDTEELADLVADFMGGIARVDPSEYNDTVARMKRQMFKKKA